MILEHCPAGNMFVTLAQGRTSSLALSGTVSAEILLPFWLCYWGLEGTHKELTSTASLQTPHNWPAEDHHYEVPLVFSEMCLNKKLRFLPAVFRMS